MSEEAPSPKDTREPLFGGAVRQVALIIYGVLVVGLLGIAVYMWGHAQRGLTSPYVIAPAIGALWFSLRLFMIFSLRK